MTSAFSPENRKSPSSTTRVPRKRSNVRKRGETVEAPLAKMGLSRRDPTVMRNRVLPGAGVPPGRARVGKGRGPDGPLPGLVSSGPARDQRLGLEDLLEDALHGERGERVADIPLEACPRVPKHGLGRGGHRHCPPDQVVDRDRLTPPVSEAAHDREHRPAQDGLVLLLGAPASSPRGWGVVIPDGLPSGVPGVLRDLGVVDIEEADTPSASIMASSATRVRSRSIQ
jgi:hypothetical protein